MVRKVIQNLDELADYKPRIALIADEATPGAQLLIKLIRDAGGKPMIIPHQLTERGLAAQNLDNDAVIKIMAADSLDAVAEYESAIASATRLHMQYIQRKLAFVDGIILPDSDYDVPPATYHDTTMHSTTRLAPPADVRFQTELVMTDYALHLRKIPILGISSGMHMLVVKTGGKLLQDVANYDNPAKQTFARVQIASVSTNAIRLLESDLIKGRRKITLPQDASPKLKMLEPRSIIGALLNVQDAKAGDVIDGVKLGLLNLHHQGVRQQDVNRNDLTITAINEHGLVEAVEHKQHPFCVGVQSHPEYNMQTTGLPMIQEMVDYARAIKLPLRDNMTQIPNYLTWRDDHHSELLDPETLTAASAKPVGSELYATLQ